MGANDERRKQSPPACLFVLLTVTMFCSFVWPFVCSRYTFCTRVLLVFCSSKRYSNNHLPSKVTCDTSADWKSSQCVAAHSGCRVEKRDQQLAGDQGNTQNTQSQIIAEETKWEKKERTYICMCVKRGKGKGRISYLQRKRVAAYSHAFFSSPFLPP